MVFYPDIKRKMLFREILNCDNILINWFKRMTLLNFAGNIIVSVEQNTMNRLIIASNRLPVKIEKSEKKLKVIASEGGLATGLKSYHKSNSSIWIGWPGISPEGKGEQERITKLIMKEDCLPVFLDEDLVNDFYYGFCNTTIWPLFHYFTDYSEFKDRFWEAYKTVNEKFADVIIENAREGDSVWVHDYQLLLLPHILKEKRPDLRIGFFLHIPFPSFEVLRILPWRKEILTGLLGADLVGFHTYDYARHFISSTKRLLGYDVNFNVINLGHRQVFIDVFPMGIDYEKFTDMALKVQSKSIQERSKHHKDIDRFLLELPNRKLILSIDRLDYTKGLPQRLKAYRHFLQVHPEYKEHVSLVLLTVPSRVEVEQYQMLKSEIEELVGRINGEFGTLNWNPVIYFYRSLPFENLIELYSSADIALLTPLRDGMNLVAKEFIATKVNQKGVLILSEMAGATKELGEAIAVNPNNIVDVSQAIYDALNTTDDEQKKAITIMQQRIKRYNVYKWASEFIQALGQTKLKQDQKHARKVTAQVEGALFEKFQTSGQRILFLDYDGTLQRFFDEPQDAFPDDDLYKILDKVASDKSTELVLISGRDKDTFEQWFGNHKYTLIADHGAWIKEHGTEWRERKPLHGSWKENVVPILESYVDRTPGSLIEQKSHSVVWHFRKADFELGELRALELKEDISNIILNQDLEILEGNKVIEVKVAGINKGTAASEYLYDKNFDFILGIGDDWTDEYLFQDLPPESYTIKVGTDKSMAKYFVDSYKDVRKLLTGLNHKRKNE
jgi:trehalose 6-phosphate synthase/phosphatase